MSNKNNLALLLKKAKDEAYTKGVMDGILMGLDIATIGVNHTHDFKKSDIQILNDEVNAIIAEIIDTADPEHTKYKLKKALKQIMGEDFESGYITPGKGGDLIGDSR